MGGRKSKPVSAALTAKSQNGRSGVADEDMLAMINKVAPESDYEWDAPINRPIASAEEYQHYMPPNMPLCPTYQTNYVTTCNRTWKLICKAAPSKMKAYKKEGIVLFYDEFFHRLFQRDPGFEAVFPGIRKRIEVLIKAMKFILNDSGAPEEQIVQRCRNLGHRHKTIPLVRPHHFAAYASTFVEVAMFWLDKDATPDVGEAWSNLVGFNLKFLLQAYLHNSVDMAEWNQNLAVGCTVNDASASKPKKKNSRARFGT
ncbi:hypothetical protein LEN26_002726 [Aphanomyces euteiches]|nr:hypothetical protein AeMF1_000755 [Aphanomyces euteiches]KAH9158792.1 hypothetical protein LEN26_002726 [Aphanomyces euteiches]KAH9185541.1 hypothetical protein AeNC1_012481 [Aphanomyces euteiches]